ncbi:uncharacterized protein LOC123871702 isoform X2 [Maniola jurtina]|nr:uncharacterized protein LOC123871702 isoform X2 [Maniola jurtina]
MLQQATDNMANQWDSEYAIWCDLSVAQGREVPAQIEHTVTKDERPPRLVLVEETEEHFLGNYVDGGDYSSGPDIPLIKKLLQEAKLAQASQPEEEEETVIEKFKNPAKNKNLAMDSILQMHNCSEPYQNGHSAVHPSTSTLERNLLFNAPSNMFKKKTKKVNTSESPKNSQSTEINQPVEQPRMFVPSPRAAEYYRKYQEQIQAQERAREDMWDRVQREMKELDLKNTKSKCGSSSVDTPAHGIDAVRLSIPRHTFTDTEDCVVCKVLCAQTEQTKTHNEPK